MSKSITTGECRLSFQKLTHGEPTDDGATKFSCVLLIPKTDTATIAALEECYKEALEEGKAKKFGGKIPATVVRPWKDGDLDADQYPEMEGHWKLNVATRTKPPVVDRAKRQLTSDEDIYSGMYVRANINLYAYNFNNTKKGITAGLNGVQKLRDGERFGGGGFTEFDELPEEAGSFLD